MGWKQNRYKVRQLEGQIAIIKGWHQNIRNQIAVLNKELIIKKAEYNRITQIFNNLNNQKNRLYANKINLENYKSRLKTHQQKLLYSIQLLEKELADLKEYINLQRRNEQQYNKEYDTIFNKVVVRNELKHGGYKHRNTVLNRAVNRMDQKYSNLHTDSKYQNLHNEYFMTINAIFWWIYYLLFIVICYQIVYIQTDLKLITKITWLTVLLLFPLLYYVYDLVAMKI